MCIRDRDMVTQEATVVRLTEGMKYSFSEPLNRKMCIRDRHRCQRGRQAPRRMVH